MDKKLKVLFLCKGEPARGQIAEGFLNAEAGGQFEGVNAATASAALDPMAEKVMQEVGIDISMEKSKTIAEVIRERFSYVIGIYNEAKERAPVFPFTYRIVKWSLEDPPTPGGSSEERISAFRKTRDQIKANVEKFLQDVSDDNARGFVSLPQTR